MTGSLCRRLLAAALLVFVIQVLSRAQLAPGRATSVSPRTLVDSARTEFEEAYRTPVFPAPPAPAPVLPRRSPLSQIARPAGAIFSGKVIAVGQSDAAGVNTASTSITFQVEQAIRGVSLGQNVTIHEWAGLWARGERYRVGERVMLFLFPPSRLGLTSPVGGAWGRFEVDPRGRIVLNAIHAGILQTHARPGTRAVVAYPEFARALRLAVHEK